jgi:hypothetical protein
MGFTGLVFAVLLLLILFGMTSMAVGGFFFVRFVRSYLQGGPFLAVQKRVIAAIQATNLGWLALACGPLLGLILVLITLPITLPLSLSGGGAGPVQRLHHPQRPPVPSPGARSAGGLLGDCRLRQPDRAVVGRRGEDCRGDLPRHSGP